MTNQNFKTLIQTKVNALAYTSGTLQAKEVSFLAAKAVGLNVDLGNIISVYNAMASAADVDTSSKDLLYLNAASLALGVTSKPASVKQMLMPEFIYNNNRIQLKSDVNAVQTSNQSGFYSALQLDFSDTIMDAATLMVTADTSEQTLVDTGSGAEGVVTQILSPRLSVTGDVTVKVIHDDLETIFTQTLATSEGVLCLGDFNNLEPTINPGVSIYYGGYGNTGYDVLGDRKTTMLSPYDSIAKGLPCGLVFRDSLKITIQGSVPFIAGSSTHKAAAAWLKYIPKGVL